MREKIIVYVQSLLLGLVVSRVSKKTVSPPKNLERRVVETMERDVVDLVRQPRKVDPLEPDYEHHFPREWCKRNR